jgi:hypothetical protein
MGEGTMASCWQRLLGSGLLLGLLTGPANADGPREFPLKYRLSVNVTEEVGFSGQGLRLIAPPASIKQEPRYHSPQPLYAQVLLGVRRTPFTLVLDSSAGRDHGYDLLYVDADRDGRITSATKHTAVVRDSGALFGPVKLPVDLGGDVCPQWFLFQLLEYPDKEGHIQRSFRAINAGYYEGVVTFGAAKHRLAVVDADGNGLYNDLPKGDDQPGDRLLIDGGQADGSFPGDKGQPLGRYLLAGDRYWQLDVAPDGSAVTVQPLDKPLGTLRPGVADCTLFLSGTEGGLRVRSVAGVARVPAGKYRLNQVHYRLADRSGRRWQFTGKARAETVVEVPAGGEVQVPLGLPLVPRVAVASPEAGRLSLNVTVSGAGGETYSFVRFGAAELPPVPKARILGADGRELALLDFHYG